MTAWPERTSNDPPSYSTCSTPFNTTVNSSNSGLCPGSCQPPGLRICAMLTAEVPELTRPTYSSINFGLLPAAVTRLGWEISMGFAIREHYHTQELHATGGNLW